jgi:hypothetical protein
MNKIGLRSLHWLFYFSLSGAALFLFPACSILGSRPVKQMSYAEAAFHAATLANAENAQPQLYLLARDTLSRARSYYRLKNFKQARLFAIKSRRLSEDAELKAVRGETSSKAGGSLVK